MVEIFGIEIDLISLVPALFGAILSLYNWFQARKPAKIEVGELVNYGFISSSYEKALFFCFPFIFENSGAKNGAITYIKIGFEYDGVIKYIDVDAKVKLNELSGTQAPQMDYEKFTNEGYRIILPTYPIKIEAGESEDVSLISTVSLDDQIIVPDKKGKMVVEVYYGAKKMNKREFPFMLSNESVDSDDVLLWLNLEDN
ncbi:MAG: hypothetical protein ACTSWC_08095 [Promethearchaeota archaeon]